MGRFRGRDVILFAALLLALMSLATYAVAAAGPTLICPSGSDTVYRTSESYVTVSGTQDVPLAQVEWSTDRGFSGPANVGRAGAWAASIPLETGLNVITVSSLAGNVSLTVIRDDPINHVYLDCSLPLDGDGSRDSPHNILREAADRVAAGGTIHLLGGICAESIRIQRPMNFVGVAGVPHPAITGGGPCGRYALAPVHLVVDTVTPMRFQHVRVNSPPNTRYSRRGIYFDAYAGGHDIALDDVLDTTVNMGGEESAGGLPQVLRVQHSSGVKLENSSPIYSGRRMIIIEDSKDVSVALYSGGGSLDISIARASVTGFDVWDHNAFKVHAEDSEIHGAFSIYMARYPGSLDLLVRNTRFLDAPVSVSYRGYYGRLDTINVAFEGTRFERSPISFNLFDRDAGSEPPPAKVVFRNNEAIGSGLRVDLSRDNMDVPADTLVSVANNTFVGAGTGVTLAGVNQGNVAPAWRARITNNIIAGGETGILVDATGLFDTTVSGNDLFGNTLHDYAGDLPDQTGQSGNISSDPGFLAPALGDYSLVPSSVCIDAGIMGPDVPPADLLGTPRPQDGDGDGLAVPDIGAYEFVLHDEDQDGYPATEDCDDGDPSIHPGAPDLPGNTVDENCDEALACDPAAFWRAHGQFVKCVARECGSLVRGAQVDRSTCDALVTHAAQLQVGKRSKRRPPGPPTEP